MNGWLTVLFFELKTVTMNKIHIMQTFFLKNDIGMRCENSVFAHSGVGKL